MYLPTHITLEPGDSGDFVAEMQRRLVGQKLLSEGNISGYYDGITTSAVRAFQSMNGLEPDGIAGPETLRLLHSSAGFFSATDGEEANAGGWGDEADKIDETGDRFDDFVQSQQAHINAEKREQAEALQAQMLQKEGSAINELRAKSIEMGLGRESHALWGQEQSLAAQQDKSLAQQSALQDAVRNQQQDIGNLERAAANREQDQLRVTRDGVQAKTLGDSLNQTPEQQALMREGQQRSEQIGQERPGQQPTSAQTAPNGINATQAQQQQGQDRGIGLAASQQNQLGQQQTAGLGTPNTPAQGQQAGLQNGQQTGLQTGQPAMGTAMGTTTAMGTGMNTSMNTGMNTGLSPDMQRTGARLDVHARSDATATGHQLDDRGVQNLGHVAASQLGQLTPSSSPQVGQQRQMGM